MDLDELDHNLLQLVLEDADRSLRELAEAAGSTAPTVKSRLERLEALELLGPVRRAVDLTRLGTLVLVIAPPGSLDELTRHEHVFSVHRTQQNQAVGLALLPDAHALRDLQEALPQATTHVLIEEVADQAPRLPGGPVEVACSECGEPVEGGGMELILGDKRYVACCPSCKKLLQGRYNRHQGGT